MRLIFYRVAKQGNSLPALIAKIKAGAPIEVSAEVEQVDLNQLIGSEDSLLVRIEGESMCDIIQDGDWVMLVRKEPKHGDIVIASLHGEYTVKRFEQRRGLYLVPANESYKPKEVLPADNMRIVGVVDYIIHKVR